MDLRTYLRALRKNWWIIVLAVVLGGLGAVAYTSQITKVYRSSVTFFVSTPVDTTSGGSSFQADQYAQRRVESYVKLAKSDELAKRIQSESGLTLPLGAIESKISASADLNTVLMTVNVDDTSPSRGLQIATAVSTQFPAYVGTLQTSDNTVKLLVTSGPSSQSAPIAPRGRLYLVAGLAAGLLLGLMIALLRELFDTSVRSVEALKTLTDLPVLGSIPLDRQARTAPIVSQVEGHSLRAEAYRQVRTGVQFAEAGARVQILVVASSIAAEGKSSTSANIALTFAESGKRALLVEADLRRPRVADYMSLDGAAGLTNVLIDQVELADVLQPWGDSGLTLLASGSLPPNPSELLGSERMSRLLDELRTMFDVIIIDTPPLVPVTDGAVVAKEADGVILVVRAGKTSRTQVLTALDVLESADTRILGCVLSMVPRRRTLRPGYDSYAYYDKMLNERGALSPTTGGAEQVLGYLPTGNPVPHSDPTGDVAPDVPDVPDVPDAHSGVEATDEEAVDEPPAEASVEEASAEAPDGVDDHAATPKAGRRGKRTRRSRSAERAVERSGSSGADEADTLPLDDLFAEDPDDESDEAPVDEPTADEAPVDEATVDEATVDGATADEAPADEATVDETTADETTADETTADETTADETTADETTADEAPADEAPADEATVDEQTVDEQTVDEPAADEATADEAAVDEAPVDETTADDTVPAETSPAADTEPAEEPAAHPEAEPVTSGGGPARKQQNRPARKTQRQRQRRRR